MKTKRKSEPVEQTTVSEKLTARFRRLKEKSQKDGIHIDDVQDIFLFETTEDGARYSVLHWVDTFVVWLFLACAIVAGAFTSISLVQPDLLGFSLVDYIHSERCLMESSEFFTEVTRPVFNCEKCRGVKNAPVLRGVTHDEFVKLYAYSKIPSLIKDHTKNWTALNTFNFHFLKKLYTDTEGALDTVEEQCQFFPYGSDFGSLADVFNMSDERASFAEGEKNWYIGWSNCDSSVKRVLRSHYQRPTFLPAVKNTSSDFDTDWIFMGGSGKGAFIHLDSVQHPSWQAQISGKKTWTLVPVPECEDICHPMNITMEKGDIIVVDTNQWYHSTFIHPGEISITIGSEYEDPSTIYGAST